MNATNNLIFRLENTASPDQSFEFDFSSFSTPSLAKYSIEYLQAKYHEGVGISYLAVLTTALIHYDDYLRQTDAAHPLMRNGDEISRYKSYLYAINNPSSGRSYSEKYIRFLASVPVRMTNTIIALNIEGRNE